eukprot:COSAG02_NODE_1161_length_14173_cov_8.154469_3_plen_143_part_00
MLWKRPIYEHTVARFPGENSAHKIIILAFARLCTKLPATKSHRLAVPVVLIASEVVGGDRPVAGGGSAAGGGASGGADGGDDGGDDGTTKHFNFAFVKLCPPMRKSSDSCNRHRWHSSEIPSTDTGHKALMPCVTWGFSPPQ